MGLKTHHGTRTCSRTWRPPVSTNPPTNPHDVSQCGVYTAPHRGHLTTGCGSGSPIFFEGGVRVGGWGAPSARRRRPARRRRRPSAAPPAATAARWRPPRTTRTRRRASPRPRPSRRPCAPPAAATSHAPAGPTPARRVHAHPRHCQLHAEPCRWTTPLAGPAARGLSDPLAHGKGNLPAPPPSPPHCGCVGVGRRSPVLVRDRTLCTPLGGMSYRKMRLRLPCRVMRAAVDRREWPAQRNRGAVP
jgi:hypothetical protein